MLILKDPNLKGRPQFTHSRQKLEHSANVSLEEYLDYWRLKEWSIQIPSNYIQEMHRKLRFIVNNIFWNGRDMYTGTIPAPKKHLEHIK